MLHPIYKLDGEADKHLRRGAFGKALQALDELIALERAGENNTSFLLSACVRKGRALVGLGRCAQAYRFLTEDVPRITKHTQSGDKNYWRVLSRASARAGLGVETQAASNQAAELELDWVASLDRAEELRAAGKWRESIAFYERSLRRNPGEPGTRSGVETASFGKARALLALGRGAQAKSFLESAWVDKNSKEYREIVRRAAAHD